MKSKRKVLILEFIFMLVLLSGCGKTQPYSSTDANKDISGTDTDITGDGSDAETIVKPEGVDLDISQMSSTMAYAEVYNMIKTPENYIGKNIRMKGQFSAFYDENMKRYYFSVIIKDEMECCQEGIEFTWNGYHSYPDDYPAEGSEVTVTGIFNSYEENGMYYCQLESDQVEFEK